MNQNITPRSREPDELDELAECAKVVFDVLEALYGREALKRDLIIAEQHASYVEAVTEGLRSKCHPARCDNHRCRRRRRCGKLERMAVMTADARNQVAVQRAALERAFPDEETPAPPAVQPPPRGHRKGRTGVRP